MGTNKPRIAIVGGGPAGLTLGVLLHKRNIPFTIFELRAQPTDAELDEPSGLLDLHEDSGLEAIRSCGLMDEFIPLTDVCSQSMAVADHCSSILHCNEGGFENKPEISRHDLTRLLLRHLPTNSIRWQRKLFSATLGATEGVAVTTLNFGPHGTEDFDFVVGADGAWSRVRPLLTDVKPSYTGHQSITATIRNITRKYPALAEFVGTGTLFCLGSGNCVMSHRAAQDSAIVYICVPSEDPDLLAATAEQPASQAKDLLLGDDKLFRAFTGTARKLIVAACDEDSRGRPGQNADFRRLYALPAGHSWMHKAGVTLVGDASHVMSPFAGEGVNVAMWDSLDLAGVIAAAWEKSPKDAAAFQTAMDGPLIEFEKKMAERAGVRAQEAIGNTGLIFAADGAKAMAAFFQNAYESSGEELPGQAPPPGR